MYAKSTGPGGQAKAFWKILKLNFEENKCKNIPTLTDGSIILTDDESKANCLNAYLVEQSTLDLANEPMLPTSIDLTHGDPDIHSSIKEITFDPSIVLSILNSLNVNKASDGLCYCAKN